jgi:hypothetical protein
MPTSNFQIAPRKRMALSSNRFFQSLAEDDALDH